MQLPAPTKAEVSAMSPTRMWRPWSPVSQPAPVTIVRARGCQVRDENGNWYLDGISGALNVSCGHGHPRLIEAAMRQINELSHYDLTNASHPLAEALAARLADLLPDPLGPTLLLNSGSEAVEAAIWIAHEYWRNLGEPRDRVITFELGYHGSTSLARHLSGLPHVQTGWSAPFQVDRVSLPGDARSVRFPENAEMLLAGFERLLNGARPAAAVLVEPLLNVGGGIVLPPGLLAGLRALCHRTGTLLIIDEVFCGFGRTGRMFGFEHDGITPDIVAMSKGISSGYVPLAAVTTTQEIHASFTAEPLIQGLRYGHTTGGHAVAAAVAMAVIDVITEDGLVANAAARGAALLAQLQKLETDSRVTDVRGLGLVTVVETDHPDVATAAVAMARRSGVLVRQQGTNIMICPPLPLDADQAAEIGDCLLGAFSQIY
ncbi:aspartate aminotransferase family protein [Nonomuraea sp. NPDC049400]|uniref:aspartate aminotransferase family protein n=1 Tax=Nonomuraea sp. NPDC049400 TaxID=3364352 RepID=UPI0037A83B8B